MGQQPRIEILGKKKLVGMRVKMSLTKNRTAELWKCFMQIRKQVKNNLTTDLISLQVYEPSYYVNFNPKNEFEKWAALEVSDFDSVPDEMERLELEGGLYAVFIHKGSTTTTNTFQYIFSKWLPNSQYQLDDRPHFEVLGKKYKNDSSSSEEEVWIPIK